MSERYRNIVVSLFITVALYCLWAIQPLPMDDWGVYGNPSHVFQIPASGYMFRYNFGHAFFVADPFSFYRPGCLLAAIFIVGLCMIIFRFEDWKVRAGLTLLTGLGFPYLGMVGAWNLASSTYTVPAIVFLLWCWAFTAVDAGPEFKIRHFAAVTVLTFFSALWHEVFLTLFSAIVLYLFLRAFLHPNRRGWAVAFAVVIGYLLAIKYYTHGGSKEFIENRHAPGAFQTFFTPANYVT